MNIKDIIQLGNKATNLSMFTYDIGDTVYLVTDNERLKRMVVGIFISPEGVAFKLACGTGESYHYAFEITKDKDIL